MQQRTFAAAGRPNQSDGFALHRVKGDTLQDGDRTVVIALPYIVRRKHGCGRPGDVMFSDHSKRSASTALTRMA